MTDTTDAGAPTGGPDEGTRRAPDEQALTDDPHAGRQTYGASTGAEDAGRSDEVRLRGGPAGPGEVQGSGVGQTGGLPGRGNANELDPDETDDTVAMGGVAQGGGGPEYERDGTEPPGPVPVSDLGDDDLADDDELAIPADLAEDDVAGGDPVSGVADDDLGDVPDSDIEAEDLPASQDPVR